MILLGTGTSNGVPVIGCRCPVCTSDDLRNQRTRTGVVIEAPEGNILIDASPELRLQLIREKIPLVHAVLFTHSHADHIFGVDDLRLCQYRLNRPLTLYCEEPVEQRLRLAFDYAFVDPDPNAHLLAAPHFKLERIGPEPFELLGQPIRPIRLMHGKLPVLGFRVNDVAFCTDVSFIPEESWPLLQGLDTLVLDALQDNAHPTHFNIEQALAVVERVKPRQTYFTHISHKLEHTGTNHRLPPGVSLAYDGLRIPLESSL
jgi:phosphoribosyl 1,2-cyclic phosphate phosphodiesterase